MNVKIFHNLERCKKVKHGMTLVEVFIAIAIFVTILVVVSSFIINIFSYNKNISGSFMTALDATNILKTMAKEIRMTSPGNDGSYPLQMAATSTLTFYTDTKGNGAKTRIRYSFSGTKIYRAALTPTGSPLSYSGSESTTTVFINVRNSTSTPIFEYFDSNYDGSTNPLAYPINLSVIRLVRINLTLSADPNSSPAPKTYSTQVVLRNLKDNQ